MLIKPRQLLKLNLKFFIDQVFIRDGNYQTITRGMTAYDNMVLSNLAPVGNGKDLAELGFNTTNGVGRVWQSAFRNWVYESGLLHDSDRGEPQKAGPIICSGVWVNGSYKPASAVTPLGAASGWDPTLYPTIDWINGRVIMSSGLDVDDTVEATFSFGEIAVHIANRKNSNFEEYMANTKYGTNPDYYGAIHYPSGRFQPLPAVFIQLPSQSHESYELGNRSLVENAQVRFHCYSQSSTTLDNILDTIRLQDQRGLPIVDFNVSPIPLSGFLGERSPEYARYAIMQSNPVLHPSGYTTLYGDGRLTDAVVNADSFEDVEYGTVDFTVSVHLIVPDGPIGTDSIGYNYWDQP
jgi:hypothetical protein